MIFSIMFLFLVFFSFLSSLLCLFITCSNALYLSGLYSGCASYYYYSIYLKISFSFLFNKMIKASHYIILFITGVRISFKMKKNHQKCCVHLSPPPPISGIIQDKLLWYDPDILLCYKYFIFLALFD